jgi:hypothetical protein
MDEEPHQVSQVVGNLFKVRWVTSVVANETAIARSARIPPPIRFGSWHEASALHRPLGVSVRSAA